jgi:IS5 family transposase
MSVAVELFQATRSVAERRVHGDSTYASQKELIASKAPNAKDFTNQRVRNRSGEVD